MATDTEQLVVDLVARVSQFERDIKRAEGTGTRSFTSLRRESMTASKAMEANFTRSAARINQVMTQSQGVVATFGRALASSLAAPLTAGGLLATLNKVKSELVAIGELSRYSGMSVGQTAALRNVATASGGSAEQMAATIKKIADNLSEAGREETEFGKLLEANGVKLKDRNGQVISTNVALGHAARLIANAANESDRIKIAEMLGVSKELIPLFARGAEHLAAQRAEQERNTQGLTESVRKAEEFDKAWNAAWGNFQVASKTAMLDIGRGLSHLIDQGLAFLKGLNELRTFRVENGPGTGIRLENGIPGVTNARGELLPDFNPGLPQRRPAAADRVDAPARGPFTIIPTSGRGGGGGASETDTAKNRLDKYIDSLARQDAVMQAQIATFGQSNAVQKAAEEIARAQVDLNRLDASTRAEVTKRLTDQVTASEALRAKLEEMQRAQRYAIEANEALRDGVKGIFTDMSTALQNGGNLFEAFGKSALNQLNRISDKLMQMAIDQLWLNAFGGNGGIFGGGGLLGGLFGAAAGGGGSTMTAILGQGGVFQGGNLTAFAKGGIVNGPTIFPFAKGVGLMGEAGAEAIMPLRRTANGDLGIIAAAGGRQGPQNVTINVQIDGGAGDAHMRQLVAEGVSAGMSQVQSNIVPTVRDGIRRGYLR